jgi:choline dehydrogenase-like flavoprotein
VATDTGGDLTRLDEVRPRGRDEVLGMNSSIQDDRRVVVIGSGPAGATAALFLARAGVAVTLLEAGSERSWLGLTLRVAGLTVVNVRRHLRQRTRDVAKAGDPNVELWEEIAPGGLTNHWSCAVPRFSPDDFQDARRAGDAYAWPVGYEDLAPWYDRVEPLLHVSGATVGAPQLPASRVRCGWELSEDWGPVAIEARRVGRSVLPLPYSYASDSTVTLSGTPFNAFVRLVKPALRTGRLSVRFDARVERLEWSPEDRRVSHVVYRNTRTGREERVVCRAVVVAAGAINTARLLLESWSADFPEGLGNTEGVLGRYLHDHPQAKLAVDLAMPMSIHPATYISRPSLDRTGPLYAAAAVQWTGTAIRAKSVLRGTPGRLSWVGFNVVGTMAPSGENRVTVSEGRCTSDGSASLALHIRRPAESDATLTRTRDEILDLLDRVGARPRTRLWRIEDLGNSAHFAGTCRMHESPRFGMLDSWSRMHAVPNVMVADSSAFTTGPEKNPVLTVMALSARGSDKLARDLRAGYI